MIQRILQTLSFFTFFILFPLFLLGEDVIEQIEIVGNQRIPRETILYYLFIKEGKEFDSSLLQKDFKALWSTGFFSDIKVKEKEGAEGKILIITVQENPFVSRIFFKIKGKLKKNEIISWLKERNESISPYSYFSPYRTQTVKNSIEELLQEKGFYSGKVNVLIDTKKNNTHELVIQIRVGERSRIGEIVFEGVTGLPESVLRKAMKEHKEHRIESWLLGKDIFKKNKIKEDLENIKRKLQEYGYMNASIGEMRIEEVTKSSLFSRTGQMKKIIIPIQAGSQYKVGEVKIEGNTAFSTKTLRKYIALRKEEIYSLTDREKSEEDIRKLYQVNGYIYVQIVPIETLDSEHKQVHLSFQIFEGEVTYLNRLEIKGNSFVKDKIIRRKVLLNEKDKFNLHLFEESLLKINQLGIVKLEREPEIQSNPNDFSQVNVTLHIKEQLKSNYQFYGGFNGYGQLFVSLDYATLNLLGRGEIMHFTFEYGKIKNYLFDLSEPYLLDYPVNFGLNVYYRDSILPDFFNRRAIGGNVIVSGKIKNYWRSSLTYGFENISVEVQEDQKVNNSDVVPISSNMLGIGNYNLSSVIISLFRTDREISSFPFRGNYFSASFKLSGPLLGGDINFIKPRIVWSLFQPLFHNHVGGFFIDYQFIQSLGNTSVPFGEKFYLGGRKSIRGYDTCSIGPRSEQGALIGGDKALVFNAEYIIPLFMPLYAVLFYDVGNSLTWDQKIRLRDLYTSKGLEIRIFYPRLPIPIRLIFASNNRRIQPDDSRFSFRFAIATTF